MPGLYALRTRESYKANLTPGSEALWSADTPPRKRIV